ncbi:hypothetical protein [Candidatus Enterovibrio altilux]|uniref:hypothetical protein n=1 Tax=Candidatus Enterovibrio altilux TaxID=1927128 RepID=UPI00137471B9|nr:hypothetical protein [Candidatus Enterovibrio luxaltus]
MKCYLVCLNSPVEKSMKYQPIELMTLDNTVKPLILSKRFYSVYQEKEQLFKNLVIRVI